MDEYKEELIKSLPKKFYFIFILIFIIIIVIKYLTSKEDILIEIDKLKNKMKNFNIDKLSILTKINTKINRDYLDNSKYYNNKGYKEIFGDENYDEYIHCNLNKNKNYSNKKNKKMKVTFNNNIYISED